MQASSSCVHDVGASYPLRFGRPATWNAYHTVWTVRDAKDSIVEFAHDPRDSAVQKLLIPAATSIIGRLRAKKDQAAASDGPLQHPIEGEISEATQA